MLIARAALLSISASTAAQTANDYDSDNDGYLDVANLAQLDAIRYDMDADGARGAVRASDWTNYTTAFPNAATGMGCPFSGCVGYELTASLDFDSDSDASDHSGAYWNSGAGWVPIATSADGAVRFSGYFKGNGHTINNLFINRSTNNIGLFGSIHSTARIETLGVTNANVTGGGFAYTRILGGRVKQTSAATAGSAITFVSGNTSPQVGTKIQANDPRPSGAVDARFQWQRCDNSDTTYTDCEYIPGVWWTNYTPTSDDLSHYLRMVVYYETSAGVWTRHATAFTGQVAAASQ